MNHSQQSVLDKEVLLDRLDGDRSLLLDMIAIFNQQAPQLSEALREALAGGDAQALRRTAHTIKGIAGEFAADRTRRLAKTLEDIGASGDLGRASAVLADLDAELERLGQDLAVLAKDQT